jgi:hypothetical protein
MIMGLTTSEQREFVASLERRGWKTEEGTVRAPSRGLWFSDSHFRDWTLEQFLTIFADRAARIERTKLENWEEAARENRDASEVAQEILKQRGTEHQPGPYR